MFDDEAEEKSGEESEEGNDEGDDDADQSSQAGYEKAHTIPASVSRGGISTWFHE